MNHFKQHYPNFCEGFESEEKDFETLEELKEIETVKKWIGEKYFYRLSISSHFHQRYTQHLLMAELKNGNEWWVIGYLKEPVELPKFEAKPR